MMMRAAIRGLVVFSALLPSAHAQSQAAETSLADARAALAAKDFARAITRFQAVLDAAATAQGTQKGAPKLSAERRVSVQLEALKGIADCKAELGDLDGAETVLWRRREILAEARGAQDPEAGNNYLELAYIQIRREAWPRAERYARDALAIFDAALATQSHAANASAAKSQAAAFQIAVNRSKVAAYYLLGLSQALQRRTADAFQAWEEGYRLGEKVGTAPGGASKGEATARPDPLVQMTGTQAGRDVWVARLRKLRAR